MALLYLVTESERDALFYKKCAVQLGLRNVSWSTALRNRKGDGCAAVVKQLEYALKGANAAADGAEEVCFIAAIDNDRTPHKENERTLQRDKLSGIECQRPSRLAWIEATAIQLLGQNRSSWKLLVALAVPVEMIEAWTVKALDRELAGGPMPHFSRKNQSKALDYYRPVDAPEQWKDLERMARESIGRSDDETFYEHVVTVIAADPEQLRRRSHSFAHFHDQLTAWP
jgi:hypothetical protein